MIHLKDYKNFLLENVKIPAQMFEALVSYVLYENFKNHIKEFNYNISKKYLLNLKQNLDESLDRQSKKFFTPKELEKINLISIVDINGTLSIVESVFIYLNEKNINVKYENNFIYRTGYKLKLNDSDTDRKKIEEIFKIGKENSNQYNSADILLKGYQNNKKKYIGISIKISTSLTAHPTLSNKSITTLTGYKVLKNNDIKNKKQVASSSELKDIEFFMRNAFEKHLKSSGDQYNKILKIFNANSYRDVFVSKTSKLYQKLKENYLKNTKDKTNEDFDKEIKNAKNYIRKNINNYLKNKGGNLFLRKALNLLVDKESIKNIFEFIFKTKYKDIDSYSLILCEGYKNISYKTAKFYDYSKIFNFLANFTKDLKGKSLTDYLYIEFNDSDKKIFQDKEKLRTKGSYVKAILYIEPPNTERLNLLDLVIRFKGNYNSLSGFQILSYFHKDYINKINALIKPKS